MTHMLHKPEAYMRQYASIYYSSVVRCKLSWAFSSAFSLGAENRHAGAQQRRHYVTTHRHRQRAFPFSLYVGWCVRAHMLAVAYAKDSVHCWLPFTSLGVLQLFIARNTPESTCYCFSYLLAKWNRISADIWRSAKRFREINTRYTYLTVGCLLFLYIVLMHTCVRLPVRALKSIRLFVNCVLLIVENCERENKVMINKIIIQQVKITQSLFGL